MLTIRYTDGGADNWAIDFGKLVLEDNVSSKYNISLYYIYKQK